jgi:tRNA-dihydrouridine synthase
MFESMTIRDRTYTPALFCAPMAGITHSAFRRLVADFGGYGALFTEMLSAGALLNETFANSPYVRRRPEEGPVFYQLLIGNTERLDAILERVRSFEPAGVDINLACGAREITRTGAGAALFEDVPRLKRVLSAARNRFDGALTVKVRLGLEREGWREAFIERARVIRDCGLDAAILHPRFSKQKFRSHARHEHLAWAAGKLGLPVVASGDIACPADVARRRDELSCAAGLMIGRMAVVQPWLFAKWHGQSPSVDYPAIWMRFYDYVVEDFDPRRRLARIKMFTEYYSRNFKFGHTLFSLVQSSSSMKDARDKAAVFFGTNREISAHPGVQGIS